MRAVRLALLLAIGGIMSGMVVADGTPELEDPFALSVPPIAVKAPAAWRIGFPCFVVVSIENPTTTRTWFLLPWGEPLRAPGPISFTLTDTHGRIVELPGAPVEAGEGPGSGITFPPGAVRSLLLDLSDYEPDITPGVWRLDAVYETRYGVSAAPPVTLTVVASSEEDTRAAAMLKAAAPGRFPTWLTLAAAGPDTLPDVDLSPEAWRELAFHELLHRLIHAPTPPRAVDPAVCDGFDGDLMEPEAALLRLELLRAREDAAADSLAASLATTHPGLRWRIERIVAGRGWVSTLRALLGREK